MTTNPGTAGVEPVTWRNDISAAPYACHVLATYFDTMIGEWVCEFVPSPPAAPWTHWMFVGTPDAHPAPASSTTSEGEVDAELIARVEHVANATGKDRWKVANLTGYDWRRILAAIRSGSK